MENNTINISKWALYIRPIKTSSNSADPHSRQDPSLHSYLSTRGTEGAIRGHGDCVEVARVAIVVGLELAVGQTPHLRHTQRLISVQVCWVALDP